MGALGEVHVVIGMEVAVRATRVPINSKATVRQDLIHIHIGAGARPALKYIHGKLIFQFSLKGEKVQNVPTIALEKRRD